ncbi:MAG: hypothetical protein WAN61_00755 [Minisyncoccia bacterium]
MSKHFFIFIFIFSFIVAGFFQWTRWKELDDFIDGSMWSHQAEYVQTGNPSEFDAKAAYGHPGGPLIEGTIAFHQAFNISYDYSLIIFISIFNALIIAVSCALCFILRKNNLWWLAVLSALSFNIMYNVSTPPTALVSPLIVLLCLLTLYFYENKEKIKTPQTLFFAFILGLAVATRADIAGFYALAFLIFLLYEKAINWKKFLIIASGSFVFFALFDPFMYFMPWQHIKDLFAKIIFHYGEINPSHMTLENIAAISSLAFIAIFLSVALLFMKKKIKLFLPADFIKMLLLTTTVIYSIFLTAHFQAPRYFQPTIFIWEAFLPLFLFNLTPYISFEFLKTAEQNKKMLVFVNTFVLIILIGFQVFLFL